jgi:hypothetical protein
MIRRMLYGGVISDPSFNKVDASGGEISYFHQYKIHTFKTDGIFQVNAPGDVSILIVGGGGRGGNAYASRTSGGGGGGEVLELNLSLDISIYDVCIGYGGTQTINPTQSSFFGNIVYPGKNASDVTSITFGYGGDSGTNKVGGNPNSTFSGGGGGGSTTNGLNANSGNGGDGGYGLKSKIGISYTGQIIGYGGGGGGGCLGPTGGGYGQDGGGNGGYGSTFSQPENGSTNTGGGGGGVRWFATYPGNGADGIVIIRYRIE